MPKFLEEKLRKEYGDNPHAIYGTMNKLGLMKGNKETKKGEKEERMHEAKTKALKHKLEEKREKKHGREEEKEEE
jgi:hypothetical protein